ncbi:uncharacterized protein K444DRAFT_704456 [Hyaloscypha bicolor E]|uniref:Rhodopsin domain-containing protein n=1 Tax=Hyaloscypha bicolor E TaxID=1095630 RepID=A0A2J6SQA7_9HELO|nr:uncharacterized protein K444DRAFT_704456 [Hyaloscypha bicolor E]PMD52930.1 hypothetical protein K444DRAFT_704456 [Hyaloscypha bicolor E]
MSLDTAYAAETRVPGIFLGLILPASLAAPFVLGRLSTRAIITRNWGTDDTVICISWILSIAGVILGSLLTKYGFGHHTMFFKVSWIAPTGKLTFLGGILFQTVVCFTKLGMCLSYLRIFEDRRSRVLLLSIMAFLVASGITTVCMIVFRCSPVSAQWMPQLGSCMQHSC